MFWIMTALGLGCWALHTLAQERGNDRARAIRCAEIDDEAAARAKEELREERAKREQLECYAEVMLAEIRSRNTLRNDRIDSVLKRTRSEKRLARLRASRGPDEVRSLSDLLGWVKIQPDGLQLHRQLVRSPEQSEYWPVMILLSGSFKKARKYRSHTIRQAEELEMREGVSV